MDNALTNFKQQICVDDKVKIRRWKDKKKVLFNQQFSSHSLSFFTTATSLLRIIPTVKRPSSLATTQLINFCSLSHVALNKCSPVCVCVCVCVHMLSDPQLFHSILINPCYAADTELLNEIYISTLKSLQIYIKCLKPSHNYMRHLP